MDPLFTNKKSSYEQVKDTLAVYRIRNTSYCYNALIKVLETHGWTLQEYNDAHQEELVVRKLQGKNG